MPLPPDLDNQIRKRFEELEAEADRLVTFHDEKEIQMLIEHNTHSAYTSDFQKLKTNFLSLLQLLATKRNPFSDLIKDVRNVGNGYPAALHGMISGLRSDYESGMLRSIAEMIEASVTTDYLEQVEELLNIAQKGTYNHVPAAVLMGAVLEDSLRRLCGRQTPPISTKKPGGHPKMLGSLIDDLKKQDWSMS